MKFEFFRLNLEKYSISNLMKTRLVGGELLHATDRKTEEKKKKKLIVAFHNFDNAPKDSDCLSTQQ